MMDERAIEQHLIKCISERNSHLPDDVVLQQVADIRLLGVSFWPICGDVLTLSCSKGRNKTVLGFLHPLGSVFDNTKMEIVVQRYELRGSERYDMALYMCSRFGGLIIDILKDVNLATVDEVVKYWSFKLQDRGWRADWK